MPSKVSLFRAPLRAAVRQTPNDPNKFDSEKRPEDFKQGEPPRNETDEQIISIVKSRYKLSGNARRFHDFQSILAQAFFELKQWYEIFDGKLNNMVSDPKDRNYFLVNDYIQSLVLTNVTRSTSDSPDVWVSGLTDSNKDKLDAEESESVLSHCDYVLDTDTTLRECVQTSLVTGVSFYELAWDKDGEAYIPGDIGPDGEPLDVQLRKAGEISGYMHLPTDVYPDPKAKRKIHDALWVIIARSMSLTDIQSQWLGIGDFVQGEHNDSEHSAIEARISAINEDRSRGGVQDKNAATVLTMLEKPSPSFKMGRRIVIANNVILEYAKWPYKKTDKYPLIPLPYRKRIDSLWPMGMVTPLIPLQVAINRIWSNIVSRDCTDKLVIMVREGTELDPDAYTQPRDYRKMYYTGEMPAYQYPPPVPSTWLEHIEALKADMQDKAGVHDIAGGRIPAGAGHLAARTVELMQNADQAKIADFVGNIRTFLMECAEWKLALYEQFGTSVPRLIGMDQRDNPHRVTSPTSAPSQSSMQPPQGMPPMPPQGAQDPNGPQVPPMGSAPTIPAPPAPPQSIDSPPPTKVMRAMTFRNFGKGNTRIGITPGSGMPKMPAAEQEQLDEWFKMGLLGPAGSPQAAESYFELSEALRADVQTDRVVQRLQELQAQAQQMQMQQAALAPQMQAQAAQTEQAHAAAMESLKTDFAIQLEQAKGQVAIQLETLKQQGEMAIANLNNAAKQHHDAQMEGLKTDFAIQAEQASAQIPESVKYSGTIDPTAMVELEKRDLGVTGAIPPPPVPAVKPGSSNPKGNTNGN